MTGAVPKCMHSARFVLWWADLDPHPRRGGKDLGKQCLNKGVVSLVQHRSIFSKQLQINLEKFFSLCCCRKRSATCFEIVTGAPTLIHCASPRLSQAATNHDLFVVAASSVTFRG